jgi:hypothetical protein
MKEDVVNKIICFAIVLLLATMLTSCGTKQVDALVIIVGRHANANAFEDRFYDIVGEYVKRTVFGGYIAVISSEGAPRKLEIFDYFKAEEQNVKRRNKQIEDDSETVLAFLRNEKMTMATTPENDLLRAIRFASSFLDDFEIQARGEKKKIREKRIIIMNTGIATTGVLDFSEHGVDNFDFSVSDDEIKDFASKIAENLSNNRALPNLDGVDIIFVGLGDVAPPQRELSDNVRGGLRILWETILKKTNVKSFESRGGTISTRKANNILINRNNDTIVFPPVRPINFVANAGRMIGNEQTSPVQPTVAPINAQEQTQRTSSPQNSQAERAETVPSQPQRQATPHPAPPTPQGLEITVREPTAITLRWNNAGAGITYRVYWSTRNRSRDADSLEFTTTYARISDLIPDTNYFFWVASLRGQQSSLRADISARTEPQRYNAGVGISSGGFRLRER